MKENISSINIEDFDNLFKDNKISINVECVKKEIYNKNIMITGAGGSIGSALSLKISKYQPKNLIVLDNCENALYIVNNRLQNKLNNKITPILADIKDADIINKTIIKYKPDLIFHTAAYKHVPLVERFPYEAIRNNIIGTKNLLNSSVNNDVNKFIFVSTDKAVIPTSVMGSTKRISEILTVNMNSHKKTKCFSVRLGNILGSNGSVFLLFKKQIENNLPITLTDKRMTRFFISLDDTVNFLLNASINGNYNEILVPNMAKPIKILDLAKKMYKYYNGNTDDFKFNEIGIRPGEKLNENLFNPIECPVNKPNLDMFKINNAFVSLEELDHFLKNINKFNDTILKQKLLDLAISTCYK